MRQSTGCHHLPVHVAEEELLRHVDLGRTAGIVAEKIGDGEVEVAVEADDVVLGGVVHAARNCLWLIWPIVFTTFW